ncbi:MAG TPA: NUDIX hydrolase [Crinalium sp.]
MTNLKKWNTLQSNLVFDHKWYKVRQDVVQLPNGKIVDDYFVSVRPDIALVFPVTSDRNIIFVRQYRHGANEILLELPAGAFNPNIEDAEIAAKRELEEETGYSAHHLTKLGVLYDNPVKETNKIHLFLAQNLDHPGQQVLDETEEIELVFIPVSDVLSHIAQGQICVSGSVAAVFLGLQFLGQI